MPLALGTAHDDRGVRDESAVDDDIVRARAAHAENAPGVEHLDTVAFEWEREMQNSGSALGIVPDGAGDEHVPDWNATGEILREVMRQPPSTRSALPDP